MKLCNSFFINRCNIMYVSWNICIICKAYNLLYYRYQPITHPINCLIDYTIHLKSIFHIFLIAVLLGLRDKECLVARIENRTGLKCIAIHSITNIFNLFVLRQGPLIAILWYPVILHRVCLFELPKQGVHSVRDQCLYRQFSHWPCQLCLFSTCYTGISPS